MIFRTISTILKDLVYIIQLLVEIHIKILIIALGVISKFTYDNYSCTLLAKSDHDFFIEYTLDVYLKLRRL